MAPLKEYADLLLPVIAILSICVLVGNKASSSAIFLLFEALLIDVYLAATYGLTSIILGASVLLTFFAMIAVGSNYYFEVSFKKTVSKPPKLNIVIGLLLFILFWRYAKDLFFTPLKTERLFFLNLNYDGLSMVVAGFALFAILVSALIIFDLKSSKSGDQT